MIYDCFPFFNELDLLEIRLRLLDGIVDKFVLIESNKTFSLKKKKLYFLENRKYFKEYESKIIHIVVKDTPALFNKFFVPGPKSFLWRILNKKRIALNAHDIDSYQRNMVIEGLSDCGDEDIIILSDVDEIPNPEIISQIDPGNDRYALEMQNFCYYLNGKLFEKNNTAVKWIGSSIIKYKNFRSFHAEAREARILTVTDNSSYKKIKNGGWHFGYLGGSEKVQYKLRSAAHTELNTKNINNKQRIQKQINEGNFIVDEKGWNARYEPIENLFPKNVSKILKEFPNLIKKP